MNHREMITGSVFLRREEWGQEERCKIWNKLWPTTYQPYLQKKIHAKRYINLKINQFFKWPNPCFDYYWSCVNIFLKNCSQKDYEYLNGCLLCVMQGNINMCCNVIAIMQFTCHLSYKSVVWRLTTERDWIFVCQITLSFSFSTKERDKWFFFSISIHHPNINLGRRCNKWFKDSIKFSLFQVYYSICENFHA